MAYRIDENGNYVRTVRCGYCYNKGHNKGSCQERKNNLVEQIEHYEKELAGDDLDEWQRSHRETYLAKTRKQLNKMLNKGKDRKCGFCGEGGHTRPTCKARKSKADKATSTAINLRKKAAQKMSADGFGPGCLIEANIYGYEEPVLAIITNICLSQTTPENEVKKDQYFSTYPGVDIRFVTPLKEEWSNSFKEAAKIEIPTKYFNIREFPLEEWYFDPTTRDCTIVSPVKIDSEQLLTPECLDEKSVKRFLLEKVVDPR